MVVLCEQRGSHDGRVRLGWTACQDLLEPIGGPSDRFPFDGAGGQTSKRGMIGSAAAGPGRPGGRHRPGNHLSVMLDDPDHHDIERWSAIESGGDEPRTRQVEDRSVNLRGAAPASGTQRRTDAKSKELSAGIA